jgi:hypothetical protein
MSEKCQSSHGRQTEDKAFSNCNFADQLCRNLHDDEVAGTERQLMLHSSCSLAVACVDESCLLMTSLCLGSLWGSCQPRDLFYDLRGY